MNAPDLIWNLRQALVRASEDPEGAAAELEAVANRFLETARVLRERAAQQTRSRGGALDRVQITVRGPDDVIKSSTDTGEIS